MVTDMHEQQTSYLQQHTLIQYYAWADHYFVGSYLPVMWLGLANEKEEKMCQMITSILNLSYFIMDGTLFQQDKSD